MPLTLAIEAYDRTQALLDGRVSVRDIEPVVVGSGPRHERMLLERLYDAGRGGRPFGALAAVERALWRKTHVYPIMHTVAIFEGRLSERPTLAKELYDAFVQAKALGMTQIRQPYATSLIWGRAALEEQEALLRDPFPYDLGEENRRSLAQLMRYQVEQGLLDRVLPVDDLFGSVAV